MDRKPFRTTRHLANLKQGRNDWYRIKAQADGPAQLHIYDEIGYFGVTASDMIADLANVTGDLEVHLNTPGGEVFDGIAIFNALKQRDGTVRIVVDSLAASIGSVIAQAASPGNLIIAKNASMMIHDGFGMAIGNAKDMREMADLLDKTSDNIASIYADRTGQPASQWRDAMLAETWYVGQEAVDAGLADHVQGSEPAAAPDPASDWDLSVFSRAPAAIRGAVSPGEDGDGNAGGDDADVPWDPDGDGDDDSTPEGDTDHSHWAPDGTQLKPVPGKPMPQDMAGGVGVVRNADKYDADDRKRMASSGQAMDDGSYPVADGEDLDNAIHAVGRGGADHDSIRAHIIKRAAALGLSSKIPDNWNADGSLKASNTLSRFVCLDDAMFANIRAALEEAQ
jgi:ATP-dependent protease ClpP protease subunit